MSLAGERDRPLDPVAVGLKRHGLLAQVHGRRTLVQPRVGPRPRPGSGGRSRGPARSSLPAAPRSSSSTRARSASPSSVLVQPAVDRAPAPPRRGTGAPRPGRRGGRPAGSGRCAPAEPRPGGRGNSYWCHSKAGKRSGRDAQQRVAGRLGAQLDLVPADLALLGAVRRRAGGLGEQLAAQAEPEDRHPPVDQLLEPRRSRPSATGARPPGRRAWRRRRRRPRRDRRPAAGPPGAAARGRRCRRARPSPRRRRPVPRCPGGPR